MNKDNTFSRSTLNSLTESLDIVKESEFNIRDQSRATLLNLYQLAWLKALYSIQHNNNQIVTKITLSEQADVYVVGQRAKKNVIKELRELINEIYNNAAWAVSAQYKLSTVRELLNWSVINTISDYDDSWDDDSWDDDNHSETTESKSSSEIVEENLKAMEEINQLREYFEHDISLLEHGIFTASEYYCNYNPDVCILLEQLSSDSTYYKKNVHGSPVITFTLSDREFRHGKRTVYGEMLSHGLNCYECIIIPPNANCLNIGNSNKLYHIATGATNSSYTVSLVFEGRLINEFFTYYIFGSGRNSERSIYPNVTEQAISTAELAFMLDIIDCANNEIVNIGRMTAHLMHSQLMKTDDKSIHKDITHAFNDQGELVISLYTSPTLLRLLDYLQLSNEDYDKLNDCYLMGLISDSLSSKGLINSSYLHILRLAGVKCKLYLLDKEFVRSEDRERTVVEGSVSVGNITNMWLNTIRVDFVFNTDHQLAALLSAFGDCITYTDKYTRGDRKLEDLREDEKLKYYSALLLYDTLENMRQPIKLNPRN